MCSGSHKSTSLRSGVGGGSTWGVRRGGDILQQGSPRTPAHTLSTLWLLRPHMALQGWLESICLGWGWGMLCVSAASPFCTPTGICWVELYFLMWHCLLPHMGNSVMTGCDPPPPPYLILISPALHFAINDSSQQNSFQHAIDSLV